VIDRRRFLGMGAAGTAMCLPLPELSADQLARPFYDVREYEHKSGDNAAIQSAIDAAYTDGGGIVHLPSGTYTLEQIKLKKNVTLQGEGMGTVLKQSNAEEQPVICTADDGSYPVAVKSMRIIGSHNGGDGIILASKSNGDGFTVPDAESLIADVFIEHTGGNGIFVHRDCTASSLKGVWVSNCKSGFKIDGSDTVISDCTARDSNTVGFSIDAANVRIINSKAIFNRSGGFLSTASRTSLIGCEASDNWNVGFGITEDYAVLTGCIADSNQLYGFWFRGSVGYMAGANATGITCYGSNTEQSKTPWVGQKYGIGILNTNFKSSLISAVSRDNCTSNLHIINSVLDEEPSNITNIVEGRLATFC